MSIRTLNNHLHTLVPRPCSLVELQAIVAAFACRPTDPEPHELLIACLEGVTDDGVQQLTDERGDDLIRLLDMAGDEIDEWTQRCIDGQMSFPFATDDPAESDVAAARSWAVSFWRTLAVSREFLQALDSDGFTHFCAPILVLARDHLGSFADFWMDGGVSADALPSDIDMVRLVPWVVQNWMEYRFETDEQTDAVDLRDPDDGRFDWIDLPDETVARILRCSVSSPGSPVRLAKSIPDDIAVDSPIIRFGQSALEFVSDCGGLKLTPGGRLPKKLMSHLWENTSIPRDHLRGVPSCEEDWMTFELVGAIIEASGLWKRRNGLVSLTANGTRSLGAGPGTVWRVLAVGALERLDWAFPMEDEDFVQPLAPFALYTIHRLRELGVPITITEVRDRVVGLLDLDQLPDDGVLTGSEMVQHMFTSRFTQRFAMLFGLLALPGSIDRETDFSRFSWDDELSGRPLHPTPLFNHAFAFPSA